MAYTELVKRLREKAGAFNYDGRPDIACDYEQAADAIEELKTKLNHADEQIEKLVEAAEERRWIPVTERLPEEDGWYQVYAPSYSGGSSSGLKNINGNMYSAFKHGKWSIEVGYHKRPGCVKAWMPLPEPPKEEI